MLLDAHDPIRRGGTGRTIDWHARGRVSRGCARSSSRAASHPTTSLRRQATVRPYAVDVSSGVEASPGIKDPARLRAFFAALPHLGRLERQHASDPHEP